MRDHAGKFGIARKSGDGHISQKSPSQGMVETNQQGGRDRLLAQVEEKLLQRHGLIVDAYDKMA